MKLQIQASRGLVVTTARINGQVVDQSVIDGQHNTSPIGLAAYVEQQGGIRPIEGGAEKGSAEDAGRLHD